MPRGYSKDKHPELYETAGDKPITVRKHKRAKTRKRARSAKASEAMRQEASKPATVNVNREELLRIASDLLEIARTY